MPLFGKGLNELGNEAKKRRDAGEILGQSTWSFWNSGWIDSAAGCIIAPDVGGLSRNAGWRLRASTKLRTSSPRLGQAWMTFTSGTSTEARSSQ